MNKLYFEKLKDPRWQKKRLKIFERDNWQCQWCNNSTLTLHVHHKKYYGEPWEAPDNKLKTLCEPCHKKESLKYKLKVISDLIEKLGFEIVFIVNSKQSDVDKNKFTVGFE